MMPPMLQRVLNRGRSLWARLSLLAVAILASPLLALAADDDEKRIEARIQNFVRPGGGSITTEAGSTALTWLLFLVMAAVCVAALFKNAKRTHLD